MDLPRISASKINTHRRCKRLTYYQLVEGVYPPTHPAAALGTEVHDLVQGWMATGEIPSDSKAGRIASALISKLPDVRVSPRDIERHLDLEVRGVQFSGRIDWWEEDGRVTDFKTTSDFKWARSADELRVDPQNIIYSADRIGDAESVRFRHLTVRTKPPHYVRETEILNVAGDVASRLDRIISEDVLGPGGISETIQATDVSQVEPTLTSCSAFGGCFFRTTCAASGVSTMGALSSIFSQSRDTKPEDPPVSDLVPKTPKRVTVAPRRAPVQPPTGGRSTYTFLEGDHELFSCDLEDDQAARMHALDTTKRLGIRVTEIRCGGVAVPSPSPPSPSVPSPVQEGNGADVNPPAPEREDADAGAEMREELDSRVEAAKETVEERKLTLRQADPSKWFKEELVAWLQAHAPTVFTVGGKKPYKWKKSELVESVRVVHRDLGVPLIWVDTPPEEAGNDAPYEEPRLCLYINASPHGESFTRLETIVADLMERVSSSRPSNEGEGDFAAHYLTIPYGQGPARVAALLKLQAKGLTGNVVVDTRSPCSAACLEVLIPLAKSMVRGF